MHLLVSLHPRIFISLYFCVLACILAYLHPHILRFMCPHLHSCILISSGSCVLACNLVSSHVFLFRLIYSVCLMLSLHTHILLSLGSCTPGACWYPCILKSSYPYIHVLWVLVGIFAPSHTLRFITTLAVILT